MLEVCRVLKGFCKNKNLRLICLFFALFKFGFSTADIGYFKLLRNGFPKEIWTEIGLFLFPLQIIVPMLYSKCVTKNQELSVFTKANYLKFLGCLFFVFYIEYFYNGQGIGNEIYFILLILS